MLVLRASVLSYMLLLLDILSWMYIVSCSLWYRVMCVILNFPRFYAFFVSHHLLILGPAPSPCIEVHIPSPYSTLPWISSSGVCCW